MRVTVVLATLGPLPSTGALPRVLHQLDDQVVGPLGVDDFRARAGALADELHRIDRLEAVLASCLDYRRDVVYGDHKDLVEEFQARVKAQQFTPLAALDLAAERDKLASALAGVRQELARERAASAVLRRIAAELAIELDQARNEMTVCSKVTRLPRSTTPG